ncbi:hypothetical protein AXG93_3109s1000 [Marchantia polymorpha subsp. ruderalis]|uniref:FBD domain-containing protein n=1 Tax=Marchantia polymorpha subsp. ruderalis TaxID=1480154 RepID=A0A176VR92_MARPO|nr:hypothetical protein AXG93_3109s1000 [Marchantia polymorpha subsp. ruderalis]
MEGAGASIVNQAAELAKREMDSADEEPELPSAIQDLVRRLGGQGEPVTRLHNLNRPQFLEFFPKRASLSTITGWQSQVRLRVLESIASCNTLEILYPGDIFVSFFSRRDISRLTDSEWELVLRRFRHSTVLREIHVDTQLTSGSDAEVESFWLQLGRILNYSSVIELKLIYTRLTARCFLNLASGLRGHSDPKLQSLILYCAWKDSSAVKHVADMINSAPLLETLSLGGYYNDMDDETLGILSQALIHSSSLKEFILEIVDWGTALLLKALAGHDRNRSIERLRLLRVDSDRLGDCLRELLISNPSLKEVELRFLQNRILPMKGKTGETSVLKKLELSVRSKDLLKKGVWKDLLCSMQGNHLTHLDLSHSELDEEAFKDLMGLMRVNLALREIDVSWGKAVQIQEALQQNQKRAVYMSVFREANLTFGDANGGRLFLCGSPRAGKMRCKFSVLPSIYSN